MEVDVSKGRGVGFKQMVVQSSERKVERYHEHMRELNNFFCTHLTISGSCATFSYHVD